MQEGRDGGQELRGRLTVLRKRGRDWELRRRERHSLARVDRPLIPWAARRVDIQAGGVECCRDRSRVAPLSHSHGRLGGC